MVRYMGMETFDLNSTLLILLPTTFCFDTVFHTLTFDLFALFSKEIAFFAEF